MGREKKSFANVTTKNFKKKYCYKKKIRQTTSSPIENRTVPCLPSITSKRLNFNELQVNIDAASSSSNYCDLNEPSEDINLKNYNFHQEMNDESNLIPNQQNSGLTINLKNNQIYSETLQENELWVAKPKTLFKIDDNFTTNHVALGLQQIAVYKNMERTTLSDILKLLNPIFPGLPVDYRTLLSTPRDTHLITVLPGKYVHIGVKSGIEGILKNRKFEQTNIDLNIFIDGVNFFVDSKEKCFWVILVDIELLENSIFPVGLYHGKSKPDHFDEFLKSFVEELEFLIEFDIDIKGVKRTISIKNFLLDAPARSSVCGTKSHNAYESCPKCLSTGSFVNRRMIFENVDSPKRTDESFKNRENPDFHNRTSIVEERLNLKMISQFPLDFLHVVLHGCVKRILNTLVGREKPKFPKSRDTISNVLSLIEETTPSEIHRSCRGIRDILSYKGHELRVFLLKIAPVVLKNNIPKDYYQHFLLLTCAFTILCDPDYCISLNRIAKSMLTSFIEYLNILYEDRLCVPMIHQTMHMPDEVLAQNAPCDTFCTWRFESYLTPLKDFIHSKNKPLSQIYKRVYEFFACPPLDEKENFEKSGKSFIYYQNVRIDTVSCKDRFFLTKEKKVIVILKIVSHKNLSFLCKELKIIEDFFKTPIRASMLNFFHCSPSYNSQKFVIKITDIERKLFYMPFESNMFFAPLKKFE